MTDLFIKILNMSFTASYIALIVMVIRFMINKAPKKYSCALWVVVFFRLICPFNIQLSMSAAPIQLQAILHDIVYSQKPSIQSDILSIDSTINAAIEKVLSPVAPANNATSIQIVITIGMFFWFMGVIALLLYGIISYFRLVKRVSTAICIHDNIYETDLIKTPFVLGFICPKIYIPTGLGEKEFEFVIKHEQAHIKRIDYLTKPLAFLVSSVHWFNPIVWFSYALMARDMELSADENVMKGSHLDIRQDYSCSLLSLSIKRSGLFSPLAFGEIGIKKRVQNILRYKKPAFWASFTAVMIVIIASVSLASSSNASEQNNKATKFEIDEIVKTDIGTLTGVNRIIQISNYSCEPTIIRAGVDFVLTVTLANTDKQLNDVKIFYTSDYVALDDVNKGRIFEVVDGSNSIYLDTIKPNESIEHKLSFNASEYLKPGTYVMNIDMQYTDELGNVVNVKEMIGITIEA